MKMDTKNESKIMDILFEFYNSKKIKVIDGKIKNWRIILSCFWEIPLLTDVSWRSFILV